MVHMFKLEDSLHISFCFCSCEFGVRTWVLVLIASVLISWICCYSHRICIQMLKRYKWAVTFFLHRIYWTNADMSLGWDLKLSERGLVTQPVRTTLPVFLFGIVWHQTQIERKRMFNLKKKSQDTVRNPLHK